MIGTVFHSEKLRCSV